MLTVLMAAQALANPFVSGVEWGAAILVPVMLILVGLANTAGLVTRRSTRYVNAYDTNFENVGCRIRAIGCVISLVGLALLIGGVAFLITHA